MGGGVLLRTVMLPVASPAPFVLLSQGNVRTGLIPCLSFFSVVGNLLYHRAAWGSV